MNKGRKTFAAGCVAGLSLFLSWPYCVFSMASLFADDAHGGALNNLCWIVSLAVLVCALAVGCALGNRLDSALEKPSVSFAAAAVQVAANAAMAVGGGIAGIFGEVVVVTGAAATGLATSLLHLCWGRRLGRLDPREVPVSVPVAYVAAFAETLLVSLLPLDARLLVILVMILAAGAILGLLAVAERKGRESTPPGRPYAADEEEGAPRPGAFSKVLTLNDYATLLFCFVSVSLVQDVYNPQRMVDSSMFAFVMLVAAVAAIVFVEVSLRMSRELTYDTVTRFLVPLCCLGLFLAAFLPRELSFVAFAITFSSMMASIMFLWISGVLYQSLTTGGIARSLGVPLIVHYAGSLGGTLAVPLYGAFGVAQVLFLLAIVLCSLVILRPRRSEAPAPIVVPAYRDVRPEAVRRIAQRTGLTEREAEIFGLYARGRDSAYICETCFISKNTVDTHLRHIYEKTGIRTKQGLIDLVESVERELEEGCPE